MEYGGFLTHWGTPSSHPRKMDDHDLVLLRNHGDDQMGSSMAIDIRRSQVPFYWKYCTILGGSSHLVSGL